MVGVGCDSRSPAAPGFLDGLKSILTRSAEPTALCVIEIRLGNVVDVQICCLSPIGTADVVATDFNPLVGCGWKQISIRWWDAGATNFNGWCWCDSRSQPAPGFLDGLKSIPTRSAEPTALCVIEICLASVLVDVQICCLSPIGTADIVATDFNPLVGRGWKQILIVWWDAGGNEFPSVGG